MVSKTTDDLPEPDTPVNTISRSLGSRREMSMFWRPVPGFEPSERAYGPALDVHAHFGALTAAAIERGELHPDAAGEEGQALGSSLIAGLLSQQLANEHGAAFEEGRFTRWVARLPRVLAAIYPPPGAAPPAGARRAGCRSPGAAPRAARPP